MRPKILTGSLIAALLFCGQADAGWRTNLIGGAVVVETGLTAAEVYTLVAVAVTSAITSSCVLSKCVSELHAFIRGNTRSSR